MLLKLRLTITILLTGTLLFAKTNSDSVTFFRADNPTIRYVGRIDYSNPQMPRFWCPGTYFQFRFSGSRCSIIVNDEMLYGKFHNYLEIVLDNQQPIRIKMKGKTDTILIADGIADIEHQVLVCKNTESNIGYIELAGINCRQLLQSVKLPERRIECIGNSITCGTGSDVSETPCGKGDWQDQHNAYMSYGPIAARSLNAQWQLTAFSGIGLIHSCCGIKMTMPVLFDKINLLNDSLQWDFKLYQPDVITVCLGQNDGVQDSVLFCKAYIEFIHTIRSHYSHAAIICLSSPMADTELVAFMKKNISAIVSAVQQEGDKEVYAYFFKQRYFNGCDSHPNQQEHIQIAAELAAYIKKIKRW
jgi:lysophospholipase L1-like esterase